MFRTLALLTAAALVAACTVTGAEKADQFYSAGDFERSAEAYRDFIRATPKSSYLPEAYIGLAWSEYKRGNFAQASEATELLLGRYPGHKLQATAMYIHALALVGERRYVECSTLLRELVMQFPDDPVIPEARFLLARSEASLLRYASAADEYQKYLDMYKGGPYVAAVLLGRADVLSKSAKWQQAAEALSAYLDQFPDHIDHVRAMIELARYSMAYSNYEDAEKVLLKIRRNMTVAPQVEIEATRMLAEIYEQTRRTQEAIEAFEQLRGLLPEDSEAERMKLAVKFADYYVSKGDTDRARKYYRELAEGRMTGKSEHARALIWLAADEMASGDREAAVQFGSRYLTSYPTSREAGGVERMLIDIYVSAGRVRDGRDRLAALLKKEDAYAMPKDFFRLASLDIDLRDYEAALSAAKNGLARARRLGDTPLILSGLYHTMIVNNLQGDLSRAIESWWNIKDIDPSYVTVTEKIYWDDKEAEFYRQNREMPAALRKRASERRGLLSIHVAGFEWTYGDSPAMELSSSLRTLLASSIAMDASMTYVPHDEMMFVSELTRREDFTDIPDKYFPLRSNIGADWIVTGSIRTEPAESRGSERGGTERDGSDEMEYGETPRAEAKAMVVALRLKLLRVDYEGIFPFEYVYKFVPIEVATIPPSVVREAIERMKLYRPDR